MEPNRINLIKLDYIIVSFVLLCVKSPNQKGGGCDERPLQQEHMTFQSTSPAPAAGAGKKQKVHHPLGHQEQEPGSAN